MRIVVRVSLLSLLLVLIFGVELFAQNQPDLKTASSPLQLAGIFSDHMVLQQQTDAPLWGTAAPGANVIARPSWSDQASTTLADDQGNWKTTLKTPPAGGPFEIEIKSGDESKILKDVLCGEVWICSGQSNMQWKLRGFGVDHFKEDVEKANHPKIRLCEVAQTFALEPQKNVDARWSVCTPASALQFSAVAYFFGSKLHAELDVPIGLISTNWGGSSAEAWTSKQTLENHFPEFNSVFGSYPEQIRTHGMKFSRAKKPPKGLNHRSPSVLYNQMIHPLIPFSIGGVIWYQGESNVERPGQYGSLFPTMIQSWRDEWNQGDFPFYFVQIAPFEYRRNLLPVALLREAQTRALELPNTGMVVTMDIGDPTNIHPKPKKPVGERLALQALAKNYGKQNLICDGPALLSHKVKNDAIELEFENVGGGLASRDGQPLSHFTIAGTDRIFHPADAKIQGQAIIVSSKKVDQPEAVRFAWGNADEPNLINREGLPGSSFRTDSWLAPGEHSLTDDGKLPNIVLMISDELAYFELSHMGNKKLRTPNIDQMARQGIRFTNALAAAPVCGPLRCCLMTGLHTGHSSMRNNRGGTPIRADEFTLADMLKKRGYVTGGFGKWGIGGRGSTGVPEKHGFNTFFGYYDQVHAHSYYPAHLVHNSKEVKLPGNAGGRKGETYAHYEIMKQGLDFIRQNQKKPFFCYLPVTPPHGMFDIPSDDPAFELYKNDDWMNDPAVPQEAKNYAAMVSMLDNDLKRVNDLLEELDLDRKTIVIFSGDNGGEPRFSSEQFPNGFFGPNVNPKTGVAFRGAKRSLYEGALKVPFIARWPGKIAPGQVNDHTFYQVDLMATFAEMIGVSPPENTDGISILPSLLGEEVVGHRQAEHELMYWEYLKQTAVRKGNWKAVRSSPEESWQLYDLETDISESNDVAAKNESLVAELAAFAEQAHEAARPGKFLRTDLQKRDREARNALPKTPQIQQQNRQPAGAGS